MTHKSERITILYPEAAKEYEGREVRLFWHGESRGCGVLRVDGTRIGVANRPDTVGTPGRDAVSFIRGATSGDRCTIELVETPNVWYLTPERHDLSREFHDDGAVTIAVGDEVRLTHEDGSVTDHTVDSYNTYAGLGVDPPVQSRRTWVSHRTGIVRVERLPADPAPDAQENPDSRWVKYREMVGRRVRVVTAFGDPSPCGVREVTGVLQSVAPLPRADCCRVDIEGCGGYYIGPRYWPDLVLDSAEGRLARIREEQDEAHRAFDAAQDRLHEVRQTAREIAAEVEAERKTSEDARFPLPEGWRWSRSSSRGVARNGDDVVFVSFRGDRLEYASGADSALLAVVRAVIARHDAEN